MSAKKRLGSVFQSIADMAANSVGSPLPPADLDYITSARAAVLEQSPKGGRYVLWAVVVFFVVTVLWASWAELDEFARGEGKVIPSQYVQVVQNLEGGILAELYVREGERVARGEKLLRIDDTQFASSLREAGVTLAQWELKSMRLRAESNGEAFKPEIKKGWPQFLVDQELAYYQSRQQELAGNKEIYDQQLTQRKQELAELEARKEQLQRSYNLLNQELQMTRPLVSQGAISEVELLRLERQVNDLLGELEAAQLAIPRVKSSLDEAKEKLASVDIVFRREAQEELNKVTLELSRLQETSEALVDRVKRTMVISPVAGTVKQLLVKTIGGVIQPGMDIVEIVPSEEIMLVEARVRPADIGYLHPGQKAKVKFSAYDFSVMGGLDGEVVHISPDTIQDEDGDSFYLVRIETNRTFIGPDGRELPIIPGMTVSVDILTGKKTILDYLLKPILKTKQLAMSER